MSTNQLILNFQKYILSCWPQLSVIMGNLDWDNDPYFVDNWVQANWELMVEKQLLDKEQFLPPYGYDVKPECRHTNIGKAATHRVLVSMKGDDKKYCFLSFTSKDLNSTKFEPPLKDVSVKDLSTGDISYLELNKVNFSIENLS
jgi:hypothetical protein